MTPAATAGRMPEAVPSERLDELYQGPLEDFTEARNRLARELRAGGDADAAHRVKKLRKPTRAAWIVNQLRVRKHEALADALERGEELRSLQERLLAGKVDRERLREAARSEQGAIEGLMKTAEAIGREHGVGSQVLDRIAETLQAASSDPEVAAAIARGHLEKEARATSLGLVGSATAAPRGARAKGGGAGAKEAERAEREARRAAARRRRAVERALGAAEKRIERERAVIERARADLAERERRLERAEREATEARSELKELEEDEG